MECELYVGKVVDEPDTWVLGTIKRVNTKFAVIQQRYEYPFAKCCGVGDFEVYTDSLIKVPTRVLAHDEIGEENEMLIQQVEALERDMKVRDVALQTVCELLLVDNFKEQEFNDEEEREKALVEEAKRTVEHFLNRARFDIECEEIENDS